MCKASFQARTEVRTMRRWFVTAAILGLAGPCVFSSAQTAPPPAAPRVHSAVDSQANAPNPDDFVGAEVCASCHDAEAKGFSSNPHSRLALEHSNAGATCETCHGPGKAHVESGGDITKIFDPAKATAQQVDQRCLTCHSAAHANFARSAHAEAGVSCLNCHSVHKSEEPVHLLRASQPTLCFQCHSDVRPQFSMPFHHKVNEGLMSCSDC